MANLIPRDLQADLSPLLVAAGEWPNVTRLTRPADDRRTGRLADARPDPGRTQQLLVAVRQLLHPALTDGPDAERLHWTTPERELFFRLRGAPDPRDPATPAWAGWASWAPAGAAVPALCVHAWPARPAWPGADAALPDMLRAVLAPALAAEALDPARTDAHPSPSVHGPAAHAALFLLPTAGFGSAYPYLYAFTDGKVLVLALQPIAHGVA